MEKLTELQKVKIVAVDHRYWSSTQLIDSALGAGIFTNHNQNCSYSYERVYAMLRDGNDWVTKKLIDFAKNNSLAPKEVWSY